MPMAGYDIVVTKNIEKNSVPIRPSTFLTLSLSLSDRQISLKCVFQLKIGGYTPKYHTSFFMIFYADCNAPRATIGRQNALTAVKLSKAAQKLRHSTRIGRHVPLTSPKDLEVAIFVKKSAQSMQTSPKTLKVAIFQEVYNGLKSKKLHILLYKIAQYLREDCTFMGGNV